MNAPLSGKQKRENMKFLLNELRDTAAFKNDQKRKDQAAQQQMRLKEQKAGMVPPMMGRPTNPEAGPKDKIPALLAPGEAVIPAKAAQKPENKPLIKAMVREGRSDRNLSVPMPKGFMCGTDKVKGYQYGSTFVDPEAYSFSDETMQMLEVPNVVTPAVVQETPRSVVVVDPPPQKIVNPNVPVQALNETDNAAFTRGKESSGNFDIGYHNLDKSSAFGAYGLTEAAYKDIQKADPYFAKKPITDLSAEDQTAAFKVYENVLADQLKAKEIEPTTENLRGAYLLGAQGLKNWQTKGELSDEAIKANGGRDKLVSIIKDRTGTGVQRVADTVLTAVSGSANASEVPKPNKDQAVEDYYKRDPNRVQVFGPDANGQYRYESVPEQDYRLNQEKIQQDKQFNSTPQGGLSQQETFVDENGVPFKVETQQEKELFKQVNEIADVPKVKDSSDGWMKAISNTLVDGLSTAWNTIKDPAKFAAATSSFLKDTLGLEASDAARYAALYGAQRAMGVSERGAALYAGKYTLGRVDKRADAKTALEQQYVNKGYTKNAQGQWVAPIITAGEVREVTFDSGPFKNKQFNLIKRQNKITGDTMWVDQASGKSEAQLVAEAGNRPTVAFTRQYTQEGIADSYRTWSKGAGDASDKIISIAFPRDRDNKASPLLKDIPTGAEIASQSVSAFKAFGYNPNDVNNQVEMDKIVAQATRDMLDEKAANTGVKIKSIEPYITKQLLIAKTGVDNSLFSTDNGKSMTATNKIASQKEDLETKLFKENPKATPAEVNDKLMDEYRKLQEAYKQDVVKKKWESRATSKESGFYLFVNDYLKQK